MVDEADRSSIDLVIGEAKLEMGKELTEYFMTEDPSLVYDDEDGVDLKIIFKRRLSNEVTWAQLNFCLTSITIYIYMYNVHTTHVILVSPSFTTSSYSVLQL